MTKPDGWSGETGDAQGGEKRKTSSSKSLSTENVKALLQPMATEPCLIRTKDWWSYELCYGKAVRQFHIEGTYYITFLPEVFYRMTLAQ